jgi:hypothetical protein
LEEDYMSENGFDVVVSSPLVRKGEHFIRLHVAISSLHPRYRWAEIIGRKHGENGEMFGGWGIRATMDEAIQRANDKLRHGDPHFRFTREQFEQAAKK